MGGRYSNGSLGAKRASKFGGRNAVILFLIFDDAHAHGEEVWLMNASFPDEYYTLDPTAETSLMWTRTNCHSLC